MEERRSDLAHAAVAASSLVYLVTLIVVPLLAPQRDVLRSHPEHYADTAAGWLVRLGYVAVALAAWSVAATLLATPGRMRVVAALLALAGGALALQVAVALDEVTGGPLLLGVFALALTPAAASIARRGTLRSTVVVLGIGVTLAFVMLAVAPKEAAGLVNRVWDGLLAIWILAFGLSDRRS